MYFVFACELHVFACVLQCFRVFACDLPVSGCIWCVFVRARLICVSLRLFACVLPCFRVFAGDLRVCACFTVWSFIRMRCACDCLCFDAFSLLCV